MVSGDEPQPESNRAVKRSFWRFIPAIATAGGYFLSPLLAIFVEPVYLRVGGFFVTFPEAFLFSWLVLGGCA